MKTVSKINKNKFQLTTLNQKRLCYIDLKICTLRRTQTSKENSINYKLKTWNQKLEKESIFFNDLCNISSLILVYLLLSLFEKKMKRDFDDHNKKKLT
jgi:hypothetical protein